VPADAAVDFRSSVGRYGERFVAETMAAVVAVLDYTTTASRLVSSFMLLARGMNVIPRRARVDCFCGNGEFQFTDVSQTGTRYDAVRMGRGGGITTRPMIATFLVRRRPRTDCAGNDGGVFVDVTGGRKSAAARDAWSRVAGSSITKRGFASICLSLISVWSKGRRL